MIVDFDADTTELLLNPRLAPAERDALTALAGRVRTPPAHVWFATSGSEGAPKLVALAKAALLASAEAVNAHVDASASDVWIHALPLVHVAGVGILARAHVSGARVVGTHDTDGMPPRWEPHAFRDAVARAGGTLTALVPTQVHDIVARELRAPASLRAVIVGGDALGDAAYRDARALGWPLLPSYGATETASQVATAPLDSLATERIAVPMLAPLPHARLRDDGGRIAIRATSLLTGYAIDGTDGAALVDPTVDGWWVSADRGRVTADGVRVDGRSDDVVKCRGETVSLAALDARATAAAATIGADAAFVAEPDARDGHRLCLAVACADRDTADRVRARVDADAAPWERTARVVTVDAIPRSALGKVRRAALRAAIESATS